MPGAAGVTPATEDGPGGATAALGGDVDAARGGDASIVAVPGDGAGAVQPKSVKQRAALVAHRRAAFIAGV